MRALVVAVVGVVALAGCGGPAPTEGTWVAESVDASLALNADGTAVLTNFPIDIAPGSEECTLDSLVVRYSGGASWSAFESGFVDVWYGAASGPSGNFQIWAAGLWNGGWGTLDLKPCGPDHSVTVRFERAD